MCFFFDAKSGTTKNYWFGLSDISYYSPYSRDLNQVSKFPNFFAVMREISLKFLIFRIISSE